MLKFYKPARDKHIHQRGYFSYILESVIHIQNVNLTHPDEDIKVYFDLEDIFGYGKGNIYDYCFLQDKQDWLQDQKNYKNIELLPLLTNVNVYNKETLTKENLQMTEKIIKKFFKLNSEMKFLFKSRLEGIDFKKTIGFHRRATDMNLVHHVTTIQLSQIFDILEKEEFENIFLMSDNISDTRRFQERYGNRLITFDELSSNNEKLPFFKQKNDEEATKKHVQEIVFGALTLGKTKKLICTMSNLSSFSILSNSKLNYLRLN